MTFVPFVITPNIHHHYWFLKSLKSLKYNKYERTAVSKQFYNKVTKKSVKQYACDRHLGVVQQIMYIRHHREPILRNLLDRNALLIESPGLYFTLMCTSKRQHRLCHL